jgi:putative ABC transport system ATP-binding protein
MQASPGDVLVRLASISKEYRREGVPVRALRSVDLEVRRGEFVAVMGPSGSGKSTLLHIIGLLDADYEGRYELAGRLVSGCSSDELARIRSREIGFVFQTFQLLPGLSILENAELPALYARDRSAQECRAAARGRLEQMGLAHRLAHRPSELSIGQRQRAAIARALVNGPSLLLADEPTGALDSRTAQEILGVLAELHRAGTTILLVTHDRDVASCAGRVVCVRDGEMRSGVLAA